MAARQDPPESAAGRAAFLKAMALLGAEHAPPVAHCHLGLGKLYAHTGKLERAREHLATATRMYREMGMTWLERAEAELQ